MPAQASELDPDGRQRAFEQCLEHGAGESVADAGAHLRVRANTANQLWNEALAPEQLPDRHRSAVLQ